VSYRNKGYISSSHGKGKEKFVARITLVKGIPFYGYHVGYQYYLKIYMLNPQVRSKLSDLLIQGVILRTVFQPYESHLQYIPQWMTDYNLFGCGYVNCRRAFFREPVPEYNETDLWHDESIPEDEPEKLSTERDQGNRGNDGGNRGNDGGSARGKLSTHRELSGNVRGKLSTEEHFDRGDRLLHPNRHKSKGEPESFQRDHETERDSPESFQRDYETPESSQRDYEIPESFQRDYEIPESFQRDKLSDHSRGKLSEHRDSPGSVSSARHDKWTYHAKSVHYHDESTRGSVPEEYRGDNLPKYFPGHDLSKHVPGDLPKHVSDNLPKAHPYQVPIPKKRFIRGSKLPRASYCSIEVDICAQDILNRLEIKPRHLHHDFVERLNPILPNERLVHSMAELWRDETRRRKSRMIDPDFGSSPFPPEVLISMSADPRDSQEGGWVHEKEYLDKIRRLIIEERGSNPNDLERGGSPNAFPTGRDGNPSAVSPGGERGDTFGRLGENRHSTNLSCGKPSEGKRGANDTSGRPAGEKRGANDAFGRLADEKSGHDTCLSFDTFVEKSPFDASIKTAFESVEDFYPEDPELAKSDVESLNSESNLSFDTGFDTGRLERTFDNFGRFAEEKATFDTLGSPEERALGSPEEKALGSPEKALGSPEKALGSPEEKALGSPEKALGSPEEKTSGNTNQLFDAFVKKRSRCSTNSSIDSLIQNPFDARKSFEVGGSTDSGRLTKKRRGDIPFESASKIESADYEATMGKGDGKADESWVMEEAEDYQTRMFNDDESYDSEEFLRIFEEVGRRRVTDESMGVGRKRITDESMGVGQTRIIEESVEIEESINHKSQEIEESINHKSHEIGIGQIRVFSDDDESIYDSENETFNQKGHSENEADNFSEAIDIKPSRPSFHKDVRAKTALTTLGVKRQISTEHAQNKRQKHNNKNIDKRNVDKRNVDKRNVDKRNVDKRNVDNRFERIKPRKFVDINGINSLFSREQVINTINSRGSLSNAQGPLTTNAPSGPFPGALRRIRAGGLRVDRELNQPGPPNENTIGELVSLQFQP
jgi:hypothetical protein